MAYPITLRQLEVFLAVAEFGSVTQAARQVHVSQPAASMALADLEKHLSVPLFDRVGNRLQLNDEGARLLPMAQEVVARTEEIWDRFHHPDTRMAGKLRIGASSTLGNYLIPQLIGEFVESHPGVELSLEVGNSEDIVRDMMAFEIDVGFIEDVCHQPELEAHYWRDDRLAVFCSPDYPLAKYSPINDPQQLQNERWILRERGSGTRHVFEMAIAGRLENLNVYLELGHSEAIKRAVMSGVGISCLSVVVLQDHLRAGDLVEIQVPFLDLRRRFYRLLHRQKYQTALLKEFLKISGDFETKKRDTKL